jgi:hypothetical protein
MSSTTCRISTGRGPGAQALLRAALFALLAAAAFTFAGDRARAAEAPPRPAEKNASWAVGALEVVSKGKTKRMPEGTFVDGYTLKAPAKVRGEGPVGDATLVLVLSSFFPAKDLPRQPRGMYYVKGTWRLVPAAPSGADVRIGAEGLHGVVTAALQADPTAGGGGFTLRTRVSPGGNRGLRSGDGALTVNEKREAELNLTYR